MILTVTPCVGVWIETCKTYYILVIKQVTPCVGVWIETSYIFTETMESLVTPCVGVWIETYGENQVSPNNPSHPAWVCGLKPSYR